MQLTRCFASLLSCRIEFIILCISGHSKIDCIVNSKINWTECSVIAPWIIKGFCFSTSNRLIHLKTSSIAPKITEHYVPSTACLCLIFGFDLCMFCFKIHTRCREITCLWLIAFQWRLKASLSKGKMFLGLKSTTRFKVLFSAKCERSLTKNGKSNRNAESEGKERRDCTFQKETVVPVSYTHLTLPTTSRV